MAKYDTSIYSMQICMESFNAMAMEQPPRDRMGYRDAAMEAMTSPDAGMLIEKLYKGIMARSGVNFGKIPDSMGDLTAFQKYKSIEETFILLDRELSQYKIKELASAHALHDNLIRLREDFQYGFKMDSQFVKTTYNSMVYALCELLNLCTVCYIDMLKAVVNQKPYRYVPYDDLLMVQNVDKFNKMVSTGEWAQMMTQIRTGAKALTGTYKDFTSGNATNDIVRILTGAGILGTAAYNLGNNTNLAAGEDIVTGLGNIVKSVPGAIKAAPKNYIGMMATKGQLGKKVGITLAIVVSTIMVIRGLIAIFWKGTYKLRDILDDNEKLLAANMECNSDNTDTSLERQQKMYNMLHDVRDKIENAILADNKKGKAELKNANANDLSREDINVINSSSSGDVTFG